MYDPNCKDFIQCINYWRVTIELGALRGESDKLKFGPECVIIRGRDGTAASKFMFSIEDAERVILLLREQIDKIKKA